MAKKCAVFFDRSAPDSCGVRNKIHSHRKRWAILRSSPQSSSTESKGDAVQSTLTLPENESPTEAINRNVFLVKEQVGLFKASSNYDIFDPDTGAMVMQCREENLNFLVRLLRFTDYKRMLPFDVIIRDTQGKQVLRVKRGISLFLSKVEVLDEHNRKIGGFAQKLFSIGGAFRVLGSDDQPVCELKGKWTSWEFKFLAGEQQLAKVTKKWAGLGKELFTSADNYVLEISPDVPADNSVRKLILAAVMCIDFVLKE